MATVAFAIIVGLHCWLGYRFLARYYRLRAGAEETVPLSLSKRDKRAVGVLTVGFALAIAAAVWTEPRMLVTLGPMMVGWVGLYLSMLFEPET